jgi:hypothetical protein
VLRRPFLQLIATAVASPISRGADDTSLVLRGTPPVPLSDVEGRIRSVLPSGWYRTPLTEDRRLNLEDESGEAQIYFLSFHERQYGPFPDTIDVYAATRMSHLEDGIDLLAMAPLRHLLVGGRPAVQSAARFWWREESRSFDWCATFIDAGDRRDEVVASDRRPERVRPALEVFLQRFAYR